MHLKTSLCKRQLTFFCFLAEIYFTKTRTTLDLVEHSSGIWSCPRFGRLNAVFLPTEW